MGPRGRNYDGHNGDCEDFEGWDDALFLDMIEILRADDTDYRTFFHRDIRLHSVLITGYRIKRIIILVYALQIE